MDGRAVLDGFDESECCTGGRGQLLIPWPNRLGGGRYRFSDSDHQLPLSEPERGNAIHGLVRWSNWDLDQPGPDQVTARYVLHPQPGYPFTLGLDVVYQLSASGLSVAVSGTNLGGEPLPYGAGQHPYLTVGTPLVDDTVLHIPAGRLLETDGAGIPTGPPGPVRSSGRDFNEPRPIGSLKLDDCFTDLDRDPDGAAAVTLANPGDGPTLTVWMDAAFQWLMVFTGDTLEPPRRRQSVAIEPMTCPPDAFRSGTDLIVLKPGQRQSATWGIRVDDGEGPAP
jgi:galactose mutarotase-like enzyme